MGVDLAGGSMTVAELFDSFQRLAIGDSVAPQTRSAYAWSLNAMRPAIGAKRLDQLKVNDVEAMLTAMAKAGAARASLSRHRSTLRRALRWAQRREWVARNVAELAELPSGAKPPRPVRILTLDEARALLDAAKSRTVKVPRTGRTETHPRRLEALWVVSLSLGLRPGEVLGLTWPAVDLDEGLVHVRTSMKYERGEAVALGEVKTGNMGRGRRSLALPPLALDALCRHHRTQLEERLAMGARWPAEWRDLVFVSEAGTPLGASNLRRELNEMAATAGVGKVTRYDLRHSAATLMAAAGMRLEDIADTLGHEDLRMARTVYVHATGRTLDTAARVMGDLLGH
jgi:integrase